MEEKYNNTNSETNDDFDDFIDPQKYSQIYSSTSDWTVKSLIDQIKSEYINLDPSYQRKDAWNKKDKSRFIESLILSIPVPNMLFAEEIGFRGKFNVLDGKQRLLSILEFYGVRLKNLDKPKMRLSGLTILRELNGLNIDQIEKKYPHHLIQLGNYAIRTTTLRNIPSVEYLYEIFQRINLGSKTLSPQELRQSRFPGEFLSFLHTKAEEPNLFSKLVGSDNDQSDGRMRDIELMLRCHSFKLFLRHYPNSISMFLDESTNKLNNLFNLDEYKNLVLNSHAQFEIAIRFTQKLFGSDAFTLYGIERKNYPFNRAVFDLFCYFFSDQKIRDIIETQSNFKEVYYSWLTKNENFQTLLTTNTHQGLITRERFISFYICLKEVFKIDNDVSIEEMRQLSLSL